MQYQCRNKGKSKDFELIFRESYELMEKRSIKARIDTLSKNFNIHNLTLNNNLVKVSKRITNIIEHQFYG